jgi:ferredoxin-fold anticodon binding domain-containing protein
MEKTRMIDFSGHGRGETKWAITFILAIDHLSKWRQQMKCVTIIDISGMFTQTSSMDVRVLIVKLQ